MSEEKYKDKKITIIRHRGTPNKGQLPDGRWIYGQSKFFIEEYGGFVPVAPYDNHFVYQMPKDVMGSIYVCSCGSPAIVTGVSGYVHDASPQGKMIVCMNHSTTGEHLTGGNKWV